MNYTRFALSLAMIVVLSPTATDMYLVSMPEIAKHFDVSYALVQLSLTVFLFAQGAGQLLFGPIIDRFGRRRPLLFGLVIFILSSMWAGYSLSIYSLILSRLVQGLSGALLLVIGFSSVRDVADSTNAAKMFAILLTIEGLAPVFAPILGGYIDAFWGWRAVLFASAVMALITFTNSLINMTETLPVNHRIPLQPKRIIQTYFRILADKTFLLPALALSSVFFYLFAYISGGAYLYQTVYGLSSNTFGLVFGITGGAIMVGAIASTRLVKRHGISRIALIGTAFIIVGTLISFISSLGIGIYGLVIGFAVAMFGIGLTEPTLVSLTMDSQKKALGFTAALMGAMHLMLSSLSTPISGFLLPLSTSYWFIFLLVTTIVISWITFVTGRSIR